MIRYRLSAEDPEAFQSSTPAMLPRHAARIHPTPRRLSRSPSPLLQPYAASRRHQANTPPPRRRHAHHAVATIQRHHVTPTCRQRAINADRSPAYRVTPRHLSPLCFIACRHTPPSARYEALRPATLPPMPELPAPDARFCHIAFRRQFVRHLPPHRHHTMPRAAHSPPIMLPSFFAVMLSPRRLPPELFSVA